MVKLKIQNAFTLMITIVMTLFIQSCSSVASKKTMLVKEQKKSSRRFANFDRLNFPNDAILISKMISIVQPELESGKRFAIATSMSKAIAKHKIEPQIMVAIIDTESNFKNDKVSTTGDLSLAQINVEVWNKELPRLGKDPIDSTRLKTDQVYAMTKMAEILKILKKRFEFKDRKWYARYHSGTRQYKTEYLNKLNIRLKMLASSPLLNAQITEGRLAQVK